MVKPLRVLICGIPNVGKSTLINTLGDKRATKTGDEPGITKTEQQIVLASDFYLFDTPGMLWPRISVERSGYHLAAGGCIGRNAYDEREVALALLGSVRPGYADRLQARYKLDDWPALSDEALLDAIGRKRGGLRAGGVVDLQKAAEIVINDFRTGAWGRVTLETPAQFVQWQAEAALLDAARLAKKAARLKKPASRSAGASRMRARERRSARWATRNPLPICRCATVSSRSAPSGATRAPAGPLTRSAWRPRPPTRWSGPSWPTRAIRSSCGDEDG
jgi:ribosome biogenesis GTPase A